MYSKNNKELLDLVYGELIPEIKTDLLENGTKSPVLDELKKLVNVIEPKERISSTPIITGK